MAFSPKQQKGIVLLANSTFAMDDIGYAFMQSQTDEALVKVKQAALVSPDVLTKLNGIYRIMPNFALTIANKENNLFVQATNQPEFPLETVSATECINKALQLKLVFDVNEQGVA